jgi:hypothetical protein
MMCDAKAMPDIVNSSLCEYYISSQGLSFMRWHVVLQDGGWADLGSLTNKTYKLNQEIAGTRVSISLLSAYTSFLFDSRIIHSDSIPISTSRDFQKTKSLIPQHTQ